MTIRWFWKAVANEQLGKGIAQLVGKPGSFRLCLVRDTLGVLILKAGSMGLGFPISLLLARFLPDPRGAAYDFRHALACKKSGKSCAGGLRRILRKD